MRYLIGVFLFAVNVHFVNQAAAQESPQVKAAISKGIAWLDKELANSDNHGERSLSALAMIKGGRDATDARVTKLMQSCLSSFKGGKYSPGGGLLSGGHDNYEAGVDAMLLANADAGKYRPQLQMILNFLLAAQHSSGAWDYGGGFRGGDTSQTQYALLGLWAAQRAGLDVPIGKIENGARWLMSNQAGDGGFAYHPRDPNDSQGVDLSMTSAGTAGIAITRLMLYPESMKPKEKPKTKKPKKFGVLNSVEIAKTEEEKKGGGGAAGPKPTIGLQALSGSIGKGMGWMGGRFTMTGQRWQYYYMYTLERLFALLGTPTFRNVDWYKTGSTYLLQSQGKDGSWTIGTPSGKVPETAFAILFLSRATGKVLGNIPPAGAGLLKGQAGLKSLDIAVEGGEVKKKKDLGPLDQLLDQLSNVEGLELEEVQQQILEKVQVGDREKLIKERDKLIKIVDNPNAELRRTAAWALGRTENIRDARLLIGRIKNDNNVDVIVEARYALCSLARRPNGFQLRPLPFDEGEYEAMSEENRQKRISEWRKTLFDKWSGWYLKVRPFDERDDIAPFDRKYRNQPAEKK